MPSLRAVALLWLGIRLVMRLPTGKWGTKAWTFGLGSSLLNAFGYYVELVDTGGLVPRWMCWFVSMIFSHYVISGRMAGLSVATRAEENEGVKGEVKPAPVMTMITGAPTRMSTSS